MGRRDHERGVPKRRSILFGGFGALSGIMGLLLSVVSVVGSCQFDDELEDTPSFPPEAGERLPVGSRVVLDGVIPKDAPTVGAPRVNERFVTLCEREVVPGRNNQSSRVNERALEVPSLPVRVGDVTVSVDLDGSCAGGDYLEVDDPGRENVTFFGYMPGGAMTVLGEVTSLDPPAVQADYHRGGSVARSRRQARQGVVIGPLFGAMFMAIGYALSRWGFGRRTADPHRTG